LAEILHPSSLDEAIGLLAGDAEAMPLAGGNAIQILRRQGLLAPRLLVDLADLDELRGITVESGVLVIGAMAALREVERSEQVRAHAPLLGEAYRRVGNVRIRHTATVGGNLAHGDYRLDPPAALLPLAARVRLAGPNGVRTLPLAEFFVDLLETALGPGELVVRVEVPPAAARRSTAFVKFSSLAANDWPCVSVGAALTWDADTLTAARVGVTCMAATPLLVDVPVGDDGDLASVASAAVEAVMGRVDPIPDLRGSVAYKRRVCGAVVRDAIAQAWRAPREPATSR
jgi:aerobic carbon-monoxide dehydrogenase medium subunit